MVVKKFASVLNRVLSRNRIPVAFQDMGGSQGIGNLAFPGMF